VSGFIDDSNVNMMEMMLNNDNIFEEIDMGQIDGRRQAIFID